jgi:lipoprotein-anchoring transpeptidase ErfK/SrfK
MAGATLAETAAAAGRDAPGSQVFIANKDGFADGLALIPLSGGAPTYFVGAETLDGVTARAIGSRTGVPCEAWSPPYPAVGKGKRIIYSNSEQQVWLINADETLQDTYLVSGRRGRPYPRTYQVFSKSRNAWAGHAGITMEYMVRFVRPMVSDNRLSIGFHAIPRDRYGRPLQTEAQLGTFQSAGCVRQSDAKAAAMYAWASIGTPVIVLP